MGEGKGGVLDQGYGLMPNVVLYNNELTDKQKLLFCLISSLCAEKGYCRASNKYLGELLGVKERTVSTGVKKLIELGLIDSDINKSKGNERHITIAIVKNHNTSCEISQDPYCEKSQDNIISNNTTTEKKENKKEKKGYGEFGLCYLTDSEYSKVISDYGLKNGEHLIKQVDNYCARKGKKYKNYAAAIRQFADSAGIKKITNQTVNESGVYDLPF